MADVSQGKKSFWSRPEGKMGMAWLAAGGVALLYFWGLVVPFVLSMLQDTFHSALLALGIGGLGYLVFGKRPRLFYRVLMRMITGWFIELDPIGILKDKISQMRKRKEEMDERVRDVSGSSQTLEQILAKSQRELADATRKAEDAQRGAAAESDPEKKLQLAGAIRLNINQAGRLRKDIEEYTALLAQVKKLYRMLISLSTSIDTAIADASNEVKRQEQKYKVTNSAFKAMKQAMGVINGNTTENEIYDEAMERLVEDMNHKMGEIDDMERIAKTFMTEMDVQNGVYSADAMKALDSFEQKMLSGGALTVDLPRAAAVGQVVDAEYTELFNPKK